MSVVEIDFVKGRVFNEVSADEDSLTLTCGDQRIVFYHEQDCCESVFIEQIDGNLEHLLGVPVHMAEVTSNVAEKDHFETATFTFLKFGTEKGYVTVRWYGTSNGYYSEEVDWKIEVLGEDGRWIWNRWN